MQTKSFCFSIKVGLVGLLVSSLLFSPSSSMATSIKSDASYKLAATSVFTSLGEQAAHELLVVGQFMYEHRDLRNEEIRALVREHFQDRYLEQGQTIQIHFAQLERVGQDELLIPFELGGNEFVVLFLPAARAKAGQEVIGSLAAQLFTREALTDKLCRLTDTDLKTFDLSFSEGHMLPAAVFAFSRLLGSSGYQEQEMSSIVHVQTSSGAVLRIGPGFSKGSQIFWERWSGGFAQALAATKIRTKEIFVERPLNPQTQMVSAVRLVVRIKGGFLMGDRDIILEYEMEGPIALKHLIAHCVRIVQESTFLPSRVFPLTVRCLAGALPSIHDRHGDTLFLRVKDILGDNPYVDVGGLASELYRLRLSEGRDLQDPLDLVQILAFRLGFYGRIPEDQRANFIVGLKSSESAVDQMTAELIESSSQLFQKGMAPHPVLLTMQVMGYLYASAAHQDSLLFKEDPALADFLFRAAEDGSFEPLLSGILRRSREGIPNQDQVLESAQRDLDSIFFRPATPWSSVKRAVAIGLLATTLSGSVPIGEIAAANPLSIKKVSAPVDLSQSQAGPADIATPDGGASEFREYQLSPGTDLEEVLKKHFAGQVVSDAFWKVYGQRGLQENPFVHISPGQANIPQDRILREPLSLKLFQGNFFHLACSVSKRESQPERAQKPANARKALKATKAAEPLAEKRMLDHMIGEAQVILTEASKQAGSTNVVKLNYHSILKGMPKPSDLSPATKDRAEVLGLVRSTQARIADIEFQLQQAKNQLHRVTKPRLDLGFVFKTSGKISFLPGIGWTSAPAAKVSEKLLANRLQMLRQQLGDARAQAAGLLLDAYWALHEVDISQRRALAGMRKSMDEYQGLVAAGTAASASQWLQAYGALREQLVLARQARRDSQAALMAIRKIAGLDMNTPIFIEDVQAALGALDDKVPDMNQVFASSPLVRVLLDEGIVYAEGPAIISSAVLAAREAALQEDMASVEGKPKFSAYATFVGPLSVIGGVETSGRHDALIQKLLFRRAKAQVMLASVQAYYDVWETLQGVGDNRGAIQAMEEMLKGLKKNVDSLKKKMAKDAAAGHRWLRIKTEMQVLERRLQEARQADVFLRSKILALAGEKDLGQSVSSWLRNKRAPSILHRASTQVSIWQEKKLHLFLCRQIMQSLERQLSAAAWKEDDKKDLLLSVGEQLQSLASQKTPRSPKQIVALALTVAKQEGELGVDEWALRAYARDVALAQTHPKTQKSCSVEVKHRQALHDAAAARRQQHQNAVLEELASSMRAIVSLNDKVVELEDGSEKLALSTKLQAHLRAVRRLLGMRAGQAMSTEGLDMSFVEALERLIAERSVSDAFVREKEYLFAAQEALVTLAKMRVRYPKEDFQQSAPRSRRRPIIPFLGPLGWAASLHSRPTTRYKILEEKTETGLLEKARAQWEEARAEGALRDGKIPSGQVVADAEPIQPLLAAVDGQLTLTGSVEEKLQTLVRGKMAGDPALWSGLEEALKLPFKVQKLAVDSKAEFLYFMGADKVQSDHRVYGRIKLESATRDFLMKGKYAPGRNGKYARYEALGSGIQIPMGREWKIDAVRVWPMSEEKMYQAMFSKVQSMSQTHGPQTVYYVVGSKDTAMSYGVRYNPQDATASRFIVSAPQKSTHLSQTFNEIILRDTDPDKLAGPAYLANPTLVEHWYEGRPGREKGEVRMTTQIEGVDVFYRREHVFEAGKDPVLAQKIEMTKLIQLTQNLKLALIHKVSGAEELQRRFSGVELQSSFKIKDMQWDPALGILFFKAQSLDDPTRLVYLRFNLSKPIHEKIRLTLAAFFAQSDRGVGSFKEIVPGVEVQINDELKLQVVHRIAITSFPGLPAAFASGEFITPDWEINAEQIADFLPDQRRAEGTAATLFYTPKGSDFSGWIRFYAPRAAEGRELGVTYNPKGGRMSMAAVWRPDIREMKFALLWSSAKAPQVEPPQTPPISEIPDALTQRDKWTEADASAFQEHLASAWRDIGAEGDVGKKVFERWKKGFKAQMVGATPVGLRLLEKFWKEPLVRDCFENAPPSLLASIRFFPAGRQAGADQTSIHGQDGKITGMDIPMPEQFLSVHPLNLAQKKILVQYARERILETLVTGMLSLRGAQEKPESKRLMDAFAQTRNFFGEPTPTAKASPRPSEKTVAVPAQEALVSAVVSESKDIRYQRFVRMVHAYFSYYQKTRRIAQAELDAWMKSVLSSPEVERILALEKAPDKAQYIQMVQKVLQVVTKNSQIQIDDRHLTRISDLASLAYFTGSSHYSTDPMSAGFFDAQPSMELQRIPGGTEFCGAIDRVLQDVQPPAVHVYRQAFEQYFSRMGQTEDQARDFSLKLLTPWSAKFLKHAPGLLGSAQWRITRGVRFSKDRFAVASGEFQLSGLKRWNRRIKNQPGWQATIAVELLLAGATPRDIAEILVHEAAENMILQSAFESGVQLSAEQADDLARVFQRQYFGHTMDVRTGLDSRIAPAVALMGLEMPIVDKLLRDFLTIPVWPGYPPAILLNHPAEVSV